ncbi:MAG: hypothetical protein A2122_02645 [Candidatus Liptonbacteria bacterium GWB1_49_6]|uniref:Uncharacterized protein n=1 Tax=Candidatus Liptonbacteria bacterium GWB1_49_6 TaxID=1798644 RepID=A0A1G2C605_9BACT|nr:MAG: hypothetical protein A2122_02645 [Candidatus Liptonbacteria bacterium GWB1_49_6]
MPETAQYYIESIDHRTDKAIVNFREARGGATEDLFSCMKTSSGREVYVTALKSHEEATLLEKTPDLRFILYRQRGSHGLLEEMTLPRSHVWQEITSHLNEIRAAKKGA